MIALVYFIGMIIALLVTAYLEAKHNYRLEGGIIVAIVIFWPIVVFFIIPVAKFVEGCEKLWPALIKMFKKRIEKRIENHNKKEATILKNNG